MVTISRAQWKNDKSRARRMDKTTAAAPGGRRITRCVWLVDACAASAGRGIPVEVFDLTVVREFGAAPPKHRISPRPRLRETNDDNKHTDTANVSALEYRWKSTLTYTDNIIASKHAITTKFLRWRTV